MKEYYCFSKNKAAWLIMNQIRFIKTTEIKDEGKMKKVHIFEFDKRISALNKEYKELVNKQKLQV